jgi:hypothetical protein
MSGTTQDKIISIKGFDANWQCRGYQFEIGKTYSHDGAVKACNSGFHACPVDHHPLSVFEFYPPAGSRFAIVEQSGAKDAENTKLASASLTITAEISIPDLVKRAWDYVWSRCKIEGSVATGARGAASATGYQGAASATGYRGAASATGDQGAASATGDQGAASATGYQGAASATGTQGAASATGYRGAASATGTQGAASATGDQGAASATGTQGAASATGDQGAASASNGSAATTNGHGGKVRGDTNECPLFAAERAPNYPYALISVACGVTGRKGIKTGVWYTAKAGKLVEVSS